MTHRAITLILIHFLMLYSIGQDGVSFHPPVKIPMYLSGNFGEIRSDHFHSGIDIKTQGSTGHRVSSVEEGYISRIKVQANGYGKSIYISHPTGYTSVYGHLDRYREDIAAYVERMQYKKQSHTVDLYPDKSAFPLDRGELVAYSGNTGSSSGPHLHFEIRSTANQHPTNVLAYNFDIKDQRAPRFHSLYVYPMNSSSQVNGKTERFSSKVVRDKGIYTIPSGSSLEASGALGISVEVFDYLDGASNRCGIHTLEMYVDNKLSYSHIMDEFAFSETRYINAHIDYEERTTSGNKVHRLHRLPNDRLRIYNQELESKPLQIEEARNFNIRIVASDVAGNSSTLEFTLKGREGTNIDHISEKGDVTHMKYNEVNSFKEGPVSLMIPANSLYQDLNFSFNSSPPAFGSLTPFYQIATSVVPVHKAYTLSIECPDLDPSLRKRLLLISLDDKGEVVSAGGEYKDGHVHAQLRKFGAYAVAVDTIAPQITPLGNMRFTITDELSGIAKYEGYIDNQWALFEYDPKNDLLSYHLDESRISKETDHELELYISDEKGNVNLLHTTFSW